MSKSKSLVEELEQFLFRYYEEEIALLAQRSPVEQNSITIDWSDLYAFDMDIAEDYIADPHQFGEYLEEALRGYDLKLDRNLDSATVFVEGVPETRQFDVGQYRSNHIGTYMGVYGQVSKQTEVKPKIVNAAFECQRCGTITAIPQNGPELQEPHECEGCERQGPFQINHSRSEHVDHQLVRLQQPPEQTRGGSGATVDVEVRGDLVETVNPGDRATFAGALTLEEPSESATVYDPKIKSNGVEVEETDYEEIDTAGYEEEIKEIAAGEFGDPFELLVNSIAPKIQGLDKIKEAIALQFFGAVRAQYPDGTVDRGDSHILLLGDPGAGKSKLLRAAEEISPRSTYASGKGASAAGMTAAAVRDDFGSQEWTLEAGALVVANKGVACVDEIDKVDDDAVASLHDALESQRVNINKAGIDATMPAETALLAAGNPEEGRFRRDRGIAEQIGLGPTLLSRFDLIFILNDKPEAERDRDIINGMVDHHRLAVERGADHTESDSDEMAMIEPAIDIDTLRAYIAYAKQNVTPVLPEGDVAEEMIDSFARLRLANGEGEGPVPVTFRKLEGIWRLAEASARVRLSNTVSKEDIDRARALIGKSMRDVGLDTESNQFDVDIIETGTSMSQDERRRELKKLIASYAGDPDEDSKLETILDIAEEKGWGRAQIEYDIKKLKGKGELYEPDGQLRLTENL